MTNGYSTEQMVDRIYDKLEKIDDKVDSMHTKFDERIHGFELETADKINILEEDLKKDMREVKEAVYKYRNGFITSLIIAVPTIIGGLIAAMKFINSLS
jgi:predicted nuclease with TOPRIM domain